MVLTRRSAGAADEEDLSSENVTVQPVNPLVEDPAVLEVEAIPVVDASEDEEDAKEEARKMRDMVKQIYEAPTEKIWSRRPKRMASVVRMLRRRVQKWRSEQVMTRSIRRTRRFACTRKDCRISVANALATRRSYGQVYLEQASYRFSDNGGDEKAHAAECVRWGCTYRV